MIKEIALSHCFRGCIPQAIMFTALDMGKEAHLGRCDGEIHLTVKNKKEIGKTSDPVFHLRTHSYTPKIYPKPYLFHVSQALIEPQVLQPRP